MRFLNSGKRTDAGKHQCLGRPNMNSGTLDMSDAAPPTMAVSGGTLAAMSINEWLTILGLVVGILGIVLGIFRFIQGNHIKLETKRANDIAEKQLELDKEIHEYNKSKSQ